MKSIISYFARNSVAANLLMITIIFLGFYSLITKIVLEVFPDFELQLVTVSVPYRGATPTEAEEGVTIRIEEAIYDLNGIEQITSESSEGRAVVNVEVSKGHDPRELLDDIKNRVDAISTFPDEIERPLFKVSQHRWQVISVVVAGDMKERELRKLGEQVRDELTNLPGISQVFLTEVRPYEVSIEVSETTLRNYGLTFDAIVSAVRRSSLDLPAGTIKTDGGEILLRTMGQAYRKEDFEKIPVHARTDGTFIRVGDIATVVDGFEEEMIAPTFNGKSAVILEVFRVGGQNAIALARTVKEYLEKEKDTMPPGVELTFWRDRSKIVKGRLNTLLKNGLQGGILVFVLLTLFLRLKVAFWVCIGIPVSFLGAIAVMPMLGVTMNILSLFAFILVLGIVVDDAIVTGENIYTHARRGGDPEEAAIRGTQEIAIPVIFGVLTTVVAFYPLLVMEGRRAVIFAQIPLVVIPVLLFSLIESKLVLPAHLKNLKPEKNGEDHPNRLVRLQNRVAGGLVYFIHNYYEPALRRVLDRRYLTLCAFIGFGIILASLVYTKLHYMPFPRVQSEVARGTLVMPPGTPFEITQEYVGRMNKAAEKLREKYIEPGGGRSVILNILATPGSSGGTRGVSNIGRVMFEIAPPEERGVDVTSSELVKEWRKSIGPFPGAQELSFRAEIGRGGDPVDIELSGPDIAVLSEIAVLVKERLSQYPGVFDITDSFQEGKEEIKLRLRPEAEFLGLTQSDLGRQVRQAFFGAEAQRIHRGREDVRVMVRYPKEERRTLASLENMRVRIGGSVVAPGEVTRETDRQSVVEVPFSDVADVEVGRGFSTIKRVDRRRTINVRADIDKKTVNIIDLNKELKVFVAETVARYAAVDFSLEGEAKEQRQSFGSLLAGVAGVFFIIYVLLAIPFKSYLQPFIVMSVIPFGLIGAFIGHFIMGMSLSMMSILGMLALIGVVVNDSLVMVDYVNQRLLEGMSIDEAVPKAGSARFRAIILTSLTTFAGLLPLMFEKSTQAQFLIPMAVSLAFGVLIATVFTLFMVPINYLILEDVKKAFRKVVGIESKVTDH